MFTEWRKEVINEIIKLRGDGLSFRKIASELNTTVGKVQYHWNKWMDLTESELVRKSNNQNTKDLNSLENVALPDVMTLKGELKAKLVTPRKVILFWDVSELPKKIIELFFNRKFEELVHVVRIYDVTDIFFNGKNAHHFHGISVPYDSGHWFIKGLAENRCYVAELGVYFSNTEFFPLYRSNCIRTPSTEIPFGNVYKQDVLQFQRYEDQPPKWMEHVSTYSYYLKSNSLEENNE